MGALKLVPCSGRLWLSWRFHGGDFIAHILQEQRWRTVEGGERVIHPGYHVGEVSSKEILHHLSQVMCRQVRSHPYLVFLLRRSHVGPRTD